MKKILLLLAMCFFCSCVSGTGGGGRTVSGPQGDPAFNALYVPEGWNTDVSRPGEVTLLSAEGMMSLSLTGTRGMEPAALANSLAAVMQGTAPLEDEGVYIFTIRNNAREGMSGEEMPVLLRQQGEKAALLFLFDPEEELLPLARQVLESIKMEE